MLDRLRITYPNGDRSRIIDLINHMPFGVTVDWSVSRSTPINSLEVAVETKYATEFSNRIRLLGADFNCVLFRVSTTATQGGV